MLNPLKFLATLATVSLLWSQPVWVSAAEAQPQTESVVVRVGVITYNDYDKTYTESQQHFARIAEQYNSPSKGGTKISFQVAVGAYDDILEWYKSGLVDVAILSPGPVAELLSSIKGENDLKDLYIGTVTLPSLPNNLWAVPERRKPGPHFRYYSMCLVAKDSPITDWKDIENRAREGNIKFMFVHPLSVSGRILPEYVLRYKKGFGTDVLSKNLVEAEWTYDHSATMRALEQPTGDGTHRVAFVWDEAKVDQEKFRKITIPELDELWIPQDVVLISSNFIGRKELMKDVFLKYVDKNKMKPYEPVRDWAKQFKESVVEWLSKLELRPSKMGQQHFTLEQIVGKLRSYENSHPGATRLALVLSGGGAKCAYQLGAIEAIETELNRVEEEEAMALAEEADYDAPAGEGSPGGEDAAAREGAAAGGGGAAAGGGEGQAGEGRRLDIGLVVGTSGGAINALSAALGITRTDSGREELQKTWLSFSQRDFFRPWSPLPFTLGLIAGLFQVLAIILALRIFDNEQINWRKYTRLSVSVLAVAATALLFSRWRFWAMLPLLSMAVIVGAQLFESRASNWRMTTGPALLAVGIAELAVWRFSLTPWEYMHFIIPGAGFLLLAVLAVLVVRLFFDQEMRWIRIAEFVIPIIGVVILVGLLLTWEASAGRMRMIARNHLIHHVWLVLTINLLLSAVCLVVIGLLMLLAELVARSERGQGPRWIVGAVAARRPPAAGEAGPRKSSRGFSAALQDSLADLALADRLFFNSRKLILRTLVVALAALLVFQMAGSLFYNTSLSDSEGMEEAFVRKLPKLLGHHPAVKTTVEPQGADDRARLEDISRRIIGGGLLQRDLVVTSSLLTTGDEPPDTYFYFDHRGPGSDAKLPPDKGVPPDPRFRSFTEAEFTPRLLDVVIGSASIYPVFDPRCLPTSGARCDPNDGSSLQLIDGGFAHNSPIEAAIVWGATHIILIEASPKAKPAQRRNLLDNSLDAFNYLFSQAQLVDTHSRGKVEIFSLRPSPDSPGEDPNLCTFDFVDFLVEGAIGKGITDATDVENPKFLRGRGRPSF